MSRGGKHPRQGERCMGIQRYPDARIDRVRKSRGGRHHRRDYGVVPRHPGADRGGAGIRGAQSRSSHARSDLMPVSIVFENLEAGATIDEIMEWFHVTREQIVAVLEFAARSLDPPMPVQASPIQSADR